MIENVIYGLLDLLYIRSYSESYLFYLREWTQDQNYTIYIKKKVCSFHLISRSQVHCRTSYWTWLFLTLRLGLVMLRYWTIFGWKTLSKNNKPKWLYKASTKMTLGHKLLDKKTSLILMMNCYQNLREITFWVKWRSLTSKNNWKMLKAK